MVDFKGTLLKRLYLKKSYAEVIQGSHPIYGKTRFDSIEDLQEAIMQLGGQITHLDLLKLLPSELLSEMESTHFREIFQNCPNLTHLVINLPSQNSLKHHQTLKRF
jgi:hypothetical protein